MKNDGETFRPLGPAKPKPEPATKPEWVPVGGGLERNQDGRLRTNKPENEIANGQLPFPYYGSPQTWGAAIKAIRKVV